jgi:hypothetical protein
MGNFNIQLNDHEVAVNRVGEDMFIVRLPEKTIHLQRRQDNEGAAHWFEEGTDNETPVTSEVGVAIESWLLQQKS